MNILKGEAMFPRSLRPSPMWRGSRSNGFSRHPSKWIWSIAEQGGKLEVTSSFLEPEADMTDISQLQDHRRGMAGRGAPVLTADARLEVSVKQ